MRSSPPRPAVAPDKPPCSSSPTAATVRVQAALPENEAGLAKPGQSVSVLAEAAGAKPYETQLVRVSGVLENPSKTMLIEAVLANADGALKPGMYANVKLGIETRIRARNSCP